MAGMSTPGGSQENPVPINVTALVDIIFCLCIFFMCTFHFRQVEGKVESWLPNHGGQDEPQPKLCSFPEDIRVSLDLREADGQLPGTVRRAVGAQEVSSDDELRLVLRSIAADCARAGFPAAPVVIDSDPRVPWREVMNVLDVCRGEKFGKLEFAAPRNGPRTPEKGLKS